ARVAAGTLRDGRGTNVLVSRREGAVANAETSEVSLFLQRRVPSAIRTLVLEGVKTRLVRGDTVLAVENEGAGDAERATLYRLASVEVDSGAGTTTVTWAEPDGTTFDQSRREVALYAFRVKAGAFGNKAPAWNTLPATLIGTVDRVDGPFKNRNWDDSGNAAFTIPPGPHLFLDAVYDAARGTPQAPGLAALTAGAQ